MIVVISSDLAYIEFLISVSTSAYMTFCFSWSVLLEPELENCLVPPVRWISVVECDKSRARL